MANKKMLLTMVPAALAFGALIGCNGGTKPTEKTVSSISASLVDTTKIFSVGDNINKTDFKVTATYSDKSTADVTDWTSNEFKGDTYTFVDLDVPEKTFNFSYKDKTTTCKVAVINKDTNRGKFVKSYKQYWETYNNSSTVYTTIEIPTIERVLGDTYTELKVTNVETIVKDDVRQTVVSYSGGSQRIDTNNYGIATLLLKMKNDDSLYTFDADGTIEYKDLKATEDEAVVHLKVNKYGYIVAMDRYNSTANQGFRVTINGEPKEEKTIKIDSSATVNEAQPQASVKMTLTGGLTLKDVDIMRGELPSGVSVDFKSGEEIVITADYSKAKGGCSFKFMVISTDKTVVSNECSVTVE